ATASITLTEPANAINVSAVAASQIQCHGGTTTVDVTATGGTPPYQGTGSFTLGAGTHSFTVTDANGCTATASITLTEPANAINVSAVAASQIQCHGGTTTVDVTATGGTPPYQGTGSFTLGAGTHSFTVTDANGCTATASITLTEPQDSLAALATAPQVQCYGGNTTVTVTATGGTPPYQGTGSFIRPAGTWTFTVTDDNNCTATATVTVTQPGYELLATATATPILCNGDLSTVTVSATGGTSPYSGTGTFIVPAGQHTYTVTDVNGCTAIASINITAPPQLSVSAIPTPILCNGGTSVVTVGAAGGTSPYNGTGTFTLPAGTYSFTVTDANNCTETETITIAEPPLLEALASATPVLCNGGNSTVTVTAAGGTGPYSGTGSFLRTAGTYTFTVTDANGCWDTVTVLVTEPPVLTVAAQADTIFCAGNSTNVTVTAAGGIPPYIGIGVYTAGAGTHTYTVTDANGCTASTIITILEPPQLVASWSAPPIACNGESTTVTISATGGTAPYSGTGQWVLTAGSYSYTVTDANNCSTTIIVNLQEPPEMNASAITTPILCHGGTTTITVGGAGGTPPYNGTGTFVEHAGTFTYIVSDANGCADTVTVTVDEPPLLTADAGATQILCHGGTSTVSVTASGGTPPYSGTGIYYRTAGTYTFSVTDANGCTANVSLVIDEPPALNAGATATPILCNGDSAVVTVTATGGTPPYSGTGSYVRAGGSYTFTVTDYHGCTTSTTILIDEPPTLQAAVSAPPINCHGGVTTVTVSASGGTPNYNGVGGFIRGAGTHTFIVTDANGCADTVSITLDDPTPIQAFSSAPPVLCNGDDATITVTASGGTAPYFGTGTFYRPAGTYTFHVVDSRGCTAATTITITEPPLLNAAATAPPVNCGNDSSTVTVTASGGTPPYYGVGSFKRLPGTHTFIVTDANGCTATATVTVIGPPPLVAAVNWTPILCAGGTSTVTVSASGGTPGYTGTGTFTKTAGKYMFIVSDANGCVDSVSVTITEPDALVLNCAISDCDYATNTRVISANASGGTKPYSYLWLPGSSTGDRLVVPCSFSGTVTVRVRDANFNANDPNNSSCEAWCSLTIMVKDGGEIEITPTTPREYALHENYPNPFNPTTTISYYVPETSSVRISVVNTLGRTIATLVDDVRTAGSHAVQWNGMTTDGTPAPSGSYIYRMHAKSGTSGQQFVRERLMMLLK
ncbi:MAG: FlgD immunoglobulin-like domain containing protein, partial [Bacteroidota bacterium]|nr:FlgD immunoglobulin-like domain containing protein [Bacteroidota bacterium]